MSDWRANKGDANEQQLLSGVFDSDWSLAKHNNY